MTDTSTISELNSPFHKGEQIMQSRTGKREVMERFGKKVIRPFMPDQHREFFNQLPFLVLGSVDEKGWPWASLLAGNPGFVTSPNATLLDVAAIPLEDDPLFASLQSGRPIGVLGIEIPTRRRNRMNAHINKRGKNGFSLLVDQSFGNCPQYIQTRDIEFIRDPKQLTKRNPTDSFTSFDDAAARFIANADTFFVSSYIPTHDNPINEGVDVSHRGGRSGFVKVDGNTLTIPDYSGNFHFNTLGNFLLNPKAGLVFPNFETGEILTLTGTVELLEGDDPEISAFHGAERGWRFILDHGLRIYDALPFRAEFGEFSPNSLMASDWKETNSLLKAEEQRNAWQNLQVTHIEEESSVIKSFYLAREDKGPLLSFEAGQFLTLEVKTDDSLKPHIRAYTVSSAPNSDHYRISVKREEHGVVSRFLHDTVKIGDVLKGKAPKGNFYINPVETRPAVLLAGGVGITPMMSMAEHVLNEAARTRHMRSLTIFHASQNTEQRAFSQNFKALEKNSGGQIRYFSLVGKAKSGEALGTDFNGVGYITSDVLRQALGLDDYDFYLCGPPAFMQALYNSLRELGVRDIRIFAEAFGPASLKRVPDKGEAKKEIEEAETTIVKFAKSGLEQQWSKGDFTLLETAEEHGLTPEFSCRNGVCGSCVTKKINGDVVYRTDPTAAIEEDEVLLCCAVPAKDTDVLELDL